MNDEARSDSAAAWTDFDWSRARYESLIRRVIPDYEEQDHMIEQAVGPAAPVEPAGPFRILELGAGTGSLSCHLLATFPAAVVTALDVSPAMLAECRQTLAPHADRAEVIEADLATADLAALGAPAGVGELLGSAPRPGESGCTSARYHAVVSRLAIHHLDDAGKERLFERVFAALKPGGVFINSDMIAGHDEAESAAMLDEWRAYMRSRGDDPAEWEEWLSGDGDYPATERAQLAWLRSAGFCEVDTLWKVAGFAMFRAVKAAKG